MGKVTTADFMTSCDTKMCIRLIERVVYQGIGTGERFHQVSFPNQRCDNLILMVDKTKFYFEVHSSERYDPDAEWQFTNMTPKQKECARAEQDSGCVGETRGNLSCT